MNRTQVLTRLVRWLFPRLWYLFIIFGWKNFFIHKILEKQYTPACIPFGCNEWARKLLTYWTLTMCTQFVLSFELILLLFFSLPFARSMLNTLSCMCDVRAWVFFALKHYYSRLSLHHNKERSKVSHFYSCSYSYVHVHTRTHTHKGIIFNQVWNCSHAWIKLWVDFENAGVVYIPFVGYYTLFSSLFSGFRSLKMIRLR